MKRYIKPTIEIVNIENEAVLASTSFGVNGYQSGATPSSKRNNFDTTDDWDDEDNEY